MRQKEFSDLRIDQIQIFIEIPLNKYRFLSSDFGIVHTIKGIHDVGKFFFKLNHPYRLSEGRIVLMKSGTISAIVNLREYKLKANHIAIVSPGTIMEVCYLSPDCDFMMLAFTEEFLPQEHRNNILQRYLNRQLNQNIPITDTERSIFEELFELIWKIVNSHTFSRTTIQHLIYALLIQISCTHSFDNPENNNNNTRQNDIFNRFIDLVNKYAIKERHLAFYANHLFLTPRYLSTVIKQSSNRTVMEWINEAITQEAKLQLCHSNKLIYQISDELNFPNPSFFCKFFRKMTGKTPYEYRTLWKKTTIYK